jgi:capsid protein
VQLDFRLVEADQVTAPATGNPVQMGSDGILRDDFGNPIAYFVLKHHPGDTSAFRAGSDEFDLIPAEAVIHLFRAERPGQGRGIPEITSSLSLYAMLRRYTLAVLGSAEQAALPSGVIYSDAPADAESAVVEPMDEVEMERGTWLTMPYGWKIGQLRAEQPTTVYGDFKSQVINEIARPLNMPYNIAAGNSSGYNYASGRLDHQAFFKAIRIDQNYLGDVVLDRILRAWLDEAVLIRRRRSAPVVLGRPRARRSSQGSQRAGHTAEFQHHDTRRRVREERPRLGKRTPSARQGTGVDEATRSDRRPSCACYQSHSKRTRPRK